jgi:transcriptional regulator with XRE-family HTH domain
MTIGEYVKTKREEKGISRFKLATLTEISHTEINRIEIGERQKPPFQTLIKIANVLDVPQEEILAAAGYDPNKNKTVNRAFDELSSEKQKDTAKKVIDLIARNSDDLSDQDLEILVHDMEIAIEHARRKKKENS